MEETDAMKKKRVFYFDLRFILIGFLEFLIDSTRCLTLVYKPHLKKPEASKAAITSDYEPKKPKQQTNNNVENLRMTLMTGACHCSRDI